MSVGCRYVRHTWYQRFCTITPDAVAIRAYVAPLKRARLRIAGEAPPVRAQTQKVYCRPRFWSLGGLCAQERAVAHIGERRGGHSGMGG